MILRATCALPQLLPRRHRPRPSCRTLLHLHLHALELPTLPTRPFCRRPHLPRQLHQHLNQTSYPLARTAPIAIGRAIRSIVLNSPIPLVTTVAASHRRAHPRPLLFRVHCPRASMAPAVIGKRMRRTVHNSATAGFPCRDLDRRAAAAATAAAMRIPALRRRMAALRLPPIFYCKICALFFRPSCKRRLLKNLRRSHQTMAPCAFHNCLSITRFPFKAEPRSLKFFLACPPPPPVVFGTAQHSTVVGVYRRCLVHPLCVRVDR